MSPRAKKPKATLRLTRTFLGRQLEMADGDTLEVHQEQVGGC